MGCIRLGGGGHRLGGNGPAFTTPSIYIPTDENTRNHTIFDMQAASI
jgi:hypothetical protein